ncbi:MAG: lipid II:glycine glycyltransferase FemX [Limnochordia bacterium]|jgi:peptidoglycan pentaglycine glycine transferase (the first glycine)
MEIKLVGAKEQAAFNEYVAAQGGDLLQSYQWGEIKSRTGWEPIRFAVLEGGRIKGTMAILKRELPGIKAPIFYAPRGPVLDFKDQRTFDFLLEQVAQLARREGALFLKIDPPVPSHRRDIHQILLKRNFLHLDKGPNFEGIQPRFVMQLDITPGEGQLLAEMKAKTRYNIRYGQRKGVRIKESCTKADLAVFYQILLETAERDNFQVRSYDYFQLLWDYLVPPGLGKLFMASYEGEYIAGAFLFRLGATAWYVYGASANHNRNVMPNYVLQWAMIRWAQRHRCRIYDFRGVSGEDDPANPLYGLYKFKTGFGAQRIEYLGEYDLVYRPLLYGLWRRTEPWHKELLRLRDRFLSSRKGE